VRVGFTHDEVVYRQVGNLSPAAIERIREEWLRAFTGPGRPAPSIYRFRTLTGTGPGADTCTVDCPEGAHWHND
jgi:hypothetical protein